MSKILHAGLSDQGRMRQQNEDCWIAEPHQGLYLVADGLGGGPAGALAAKLVATVLPKLLEPEFRDADDWAAQSALDRLRAAIVTLSEQLRDRAKGKPGLDGMGSTVVLALIHEQRVLVGHLGDSRAYLWRKGRLCQLTKDHSVEQLLLDCGEKAPSRKPGAADQGRLTRFVGMARDPLPDTRGFDLCSGDRLLLCSDGLTRALDNAQLLTHLSRRAEPGETCKRLIAAANEAGGDDNITALVVQAP